MHVCLRDRPRRCECVHVRRVQDEWQPAAEALVRGCHGGAAALRGAGAGTRARLALLLGGRGPRAAGSAWCFRPRKVVAEQLALLWVRHFGRWSERRFGEVGTGYYDDDSDSDSPGEV